MSVVDAIHSAVEWLLGIADHLPRFWAVTVLSVFSGAGMLWVVGKTTNQRKLERARDNMISTVYEVRIYLDAPRRVFASQGRLLWWSARYMAIVLPAFFVLALPLLFLYVHMDLHYGVAPLATGTPTIVRVGLADNVSGHHIALVASSDHVELTAPPIFVANEKAVFFRIQVIQAGDHQIRIRSGEHTVTKTVSAQANASRVSPERTAGLGSLWAWGYEGALSTGNGIRSITITHPFRDDTYLGIAMPWWLYWLIVSMGTALTLRKPMGVVI